MGLIRYYWENFKAWRRGEVRIAPRGVTGRVFAKKNAEPAPDTGMSTMVRGKVSTELKITKADGTVHVVHLPDKEI